MIDVVLPFFNAPEALAQCLNALSHALSRQAAVILVDDASDAPAVAVADTWCAKAPFKIQRIRMETNRGFLRSVQAGIAAAEAPHFLLLNSDTAPLPGFAEKLHDVLQRQPAVKMAAPVSNNPGDLFQFRDDCAGLSGPCDPRLPQAALRRAREWPGRVTRVPYLTAACLLIDRAAYEDAGGFCNAYEHGYFEDLDLSCRMRQAGHILAVREDCLVYHAGRGSYGRFDPARRESLMLRNYQTFCAKWATLPDHPALLAKLEAAQ